MLGVTRAFAVAAIAGALILLPVGAFDAAVAGSGEAGQASPVPGLKRIFAAGFEAPVSLHPNKRGNRVRLKGKDNRGYRWEDLDHVFELVAANSVDNLVTIHFSSENYFEGSRSLYMRQNKMVNGTQARLQFFGNDETFGPEVFTRRRYFIPSSNLGSLAKQDASASIAGTREARGRVVPFSIAGGADFSMPLYAVRRGEKLVFAQALVDYSAGPRWSDWTRPPKGLLTFGQMTEVPLDRWFKLDIYLLRDPSEGKLKVWVDDRIIFDLEGVRTKNDTSRWFTKLADVDSEPAPFELWTDDVEIWARR